tara:strand:- start:544 stop:1380 length:837 start_codon:yes stop_codon:yes gene_type:complete
MLYLIIINLREKIIKCVNIHKDIILKVESFDKKNLQNFNFQNNFNKSNKNTNLINSILIIDTETTGLDEKKDEVIEVGCILFNVPSKAVLSQLSFLLPVKNNQAEFINKISSEVSNIPQPWNDSLNLFLKLVDFADYIVAHNVEFDKKWFNDKNLPSLDKNWICSLDDIDWSFLKTLKSRPSVTDLSIAFNIPVWNLHRALSDCYYLSEVFKRCENLQELLFKASQPRYLYKAIVSYEDRTLAKNAGFRWNSPVQGAWTRKLSENEATNLDFKVEILG